MVIIHVTDSDDFGWILTKIFRRISKDITHVFEESFMNSMNSTAANKAQCLQMTLTKINDRQYLFTHGNLPTLSNTSAMYGAMPLFRYRKSSATFPIKAAHFNICALLQAPSFPTRSLLLQLFIVAASLLIGHKWLRCVTVKWFACFVLNRNLSFYTLALCIDLPYIIRC